MKNANTPSIDNLLPLYIYTLIFTRKSAATSYDFSKISVSIKVLKGSKKNNIQEPAECRKNTVGLSQRTFILNCSIYR